jgi:hypothetical protein
MGQQLYSRTAVAALLLACASAATETQPSPAVLTAVDLTDATRESCRILLRIQGRVEGIKTTPLENGRFVFDLASVTWGGPTRRVRPNVPGIYEYRYSQFSRDPPITRFVVEVGADWSCRHDRDPSGLLVVCGGPPILEAGRSAAVGPTIAVVRGMEIVSPVAGLDAEKLVDRSLGFTPRDMVRDGLPHFGSMRDDWIGAPRRHKGLDIYIDNAAVRAAANGKVVGAGQGERAGGWIKIGHGNGVETVYVHISGSNVKTGEDVTRGQRIAAVDGAVGNAVQPQLHFELRLDGQSVDPVPFIFDLAPEDLKRRITQENQRLTVLEQEREALVRRWIEGNPQ